MNEPPEFFQQFLYLDHQNELSTLFLLLKTKNDNIKKSGTEVFRWEIKLE